MRAERDGWQALDFAICLSDEVVRFYEMELPPHMEGDEWREAAHWELDARLMAEGLDADAYAMAYRRQGEASVLLAAAEHQYLEGIHRASPCAAWLLLHLMMAAMRLCWQRTAWSSCRRSACSCRPSPLPLLRFRTSRF